MCGVSNVWGSETIENAESAKLFFSKGEALFENEAYLEAAATFRRAYELAPHPSALCNIGYSYEFASEYAKAIIAYREYLDSAFDKEPDTVIDIRNRLAMLRHMVGELNIQCQPAECTVEVDGLVKGETKEGTLLVVMKPGKYSVTVRWRDDARIVTKEYPVEAGRMTHARFSYETTLKAAASAARRRSVSSVDGDGDESAGASPSTIRLNADDDKTGGTTSGTTIAVYALGGSALAGGVMVSVFGGLTLSSKKRYKDSNYRDADAWNDTRRNKIITNVSVGFSLAMVASAVAITFFRSRSDQQEGKKTSLSLSSNPGNVLSLKGRF